MVYNYHSAHNVLICLICIDEKNETELNVWKMNKFQLWLNKWFSTVWHQMSQILKYLLSYEQWTMNNSDELVRIFDPSFLFRTLSIWPKIEWSLVLSQAWLHIIIIDEPSTLNLMNSHRYQMRAAKALKPKKKAHPCTMHSTHNIIAIVSVRQNINVQFSYVLKCLEILRLDKYNFSTFIWNGVCSVHCAQS